MESQLVNKKILFIINPVSGVGRHQKAEKLIRDYFQPLEVRPEIRYTEAQGHATILSRQAAAEGFDIVVAVGGDGTVNETATGLIGSSTAMAILPAGSGNGLARHLRIPMNLRRALRVIVSGHPAAIDTATINDEVFVNVAGVGFDAAVARRFAEAGTRGFSTYFRITASSYKDYKPKNYKLKIDGRTIRRRALLISFANSSQFGNNTTIDPGASVSDGFIDVCIVGKMPLWKTLFLAPLLFLKMFDQTRYVEIIRAKEVHLVRKKGKTIHLDGDPKIMGKDLVMKINPLSLIVIVP